MISKHIYAKLSYTSEQSFVFLLYFTLSKAPVTGGNFIELVKRGFYDNMDIQRSDGFVVQTGDPKGEADGYVAPPSKSVGSGKHGERLIPLEIFAKGDKGPFRNNPLSSHIWRR